ncbi:hypothetical protein MIND_01145200 [Mycena indigotica]|uniref:Uncharacterized protein n=1 Tax=Mycena indigotica TaxID=2126181 RepID=A0A8H6S6F9_9AGAR|nr:uncharacterized protein MIND_01145200 [Mycena indigotica]KAF7293653.1 hypothetical protein MIND_01145200 [Mycena indigotica]
MAPSLNLERKYRPVANDEAERKQIPRSVITYLHLDKKFPNWLHQEVAKELLTNTNIPQDYCFLAFHDIYPKAMLDPVLAQLPQGMERTHKLMLLDAMRNREKKNHNRTIKSKKTKKKQNLGNRNSGLSTAPGPFIDRQLSDKEDAAPHDRPKPAAFSKAPRLPDVPILSRLRVFPSCSPRRIPTEDGESISTYAGPLRRSASTSSGRSSPDPLGVSPTVFGDEISDITSNDWVWDAKVSDDELSELDDEVSEGSESNAEVTDDRVSERAERAESVVSSRPSTSSPDLRMPRNIFLEDTQANTKKLETLLEDEVAVNHAIAMVIWDDSIWSSLCCMDPSVQASYLHECLLEFRQDDFDIPTRSAGPLKTTVKIIRNLFQDRTSEVFGRVMKEGTLFPYTLNVLEILGGMAGKSDEEKASMQRLFLMSLSEL